MEGKGSARRKAGGYTEALTGERLKPDWVKARVKEKEKAILDKIKL